MSHICSRCNKDFKYESILKRHINKKKQCTIEIINNIDTNSKPIYNSTLNSNELYLKNIADLFTIFISTITNNNNNNNINNINNNLLNNINNINNINNNKNINNNNKIICKKCEIIFSSKSSLCNHNKNGRCKGNKSITIPITETIIKPINNDSIIQEPLIKKGTTFNDLLGITISESDNTVINNNSNNTTNNINTTNNYITINAFGCENIKHITIGEFKAAFNTINLTKILENLAELIYIKNVNNMNFTKQNTNKQIVTYLNDNMSIKRMSEKEFFKEFEKNIKKLCIELFYIYKDDLKHEDLIEYIKCFLLLNQSLFDKTNYKILQNDLANVTDSLFRNKKIIDLINDIELNIETNDELKENYKRNNISRLKQIKIASNNYYLKNKDIEQNKDNKINLNDVKNIAFEKIKLEQKKIDDKYYNKDNRDDNNNNKINIDKYNNNNKIINNRQKAIEDDIEKSETNITNPIPKKKKVIVINDEE